MLYVVWWAAANNIFEKLAAPSLQKATIFIFTAMKISYFT